MKIILSVSFICAVFISNNLFAASSCQEVQNSVTAAKDAVAQNKLDRAAAALAKATAWIGYSDNCFGPVVCVYWDGWNSRILNSSNTMPPECDEKNDKDKICRCDKISCSLPITVDNGDGTTSQSSEDKPTVAQYCRAQCKVWRSNDKSLPVYDATLPTLESALAALEQQRDTLCTGACSGIPTGPALDRCNCDEAGDPWTWDTTTSPASCVACKGLSGEAKDICDCVKVRKSMWDSVAKACQPGVGSLCVGKIGEEYDICMCGDKKLKWDATTKTCLSASTPGSGPTVFSSTTPQGAGPSGSTESPGGKAETTSNKSPDAQTLSLGGIPDYGSEYTGNEVLGGGDKKSGTWFDRFINSLASLPDDKKGDDESLSGDDDVSGGGDGGSGGDESKEDSTKVRTDIGSSSEKNDIFKTVNNVYNKKKYLFPAGEADEGGVVIK